MRQWLAKLESRGSSAARLSALCGMLGLVAFILVTIFDVMMRWLFNNPIDGVSDVAPLVIAIVVSSFFPFALAERCHVSIEFLGNLLSPRQRAWLRAFVALVTWGFFLLLAWQFIVYTIDLHEVGQTTWVVQIPVAPWWVVVSIFIVLSVAVQSIILMVQMRRAVNGDDAGRAQFVSSNDTSRKNGEI